MRYYKPAVMLLMTLAILVIALPAMAQSGDGYDLSWWTVDAGGQTFSTDGRYSLGGTTGQPDAAVVEGGAYTLIGGFWTGPLVEYRSCLPLALRSY